MKISIVTLSFNQHDYLKEAMDSVLSQGYPDLEYIVVDPGSTDGSRELIRSYGERIAHTIFEPDRGAADGLNKGFARATGEVFGFLNADDLLFPHALNRVAEFFDAHPECDMAMGNGYVVDGSGRRVRHIVARRFTVRRYLHGSRQWMQMSTFFRRELFDRVHGFNVANRSSWDGELFLDMAHQGARVGYINADLSGFRLHKASITGSGRMQKAGMDDHSRMFRRICGRDWGVKDDLLRFLYRGENALVRAGWMLERLMKRDFH